MMRWMMISGLMLVTLLQALAADLEGPTEPDVLAVMPMDPAAAMEAWENADQWAAAPSEELGRDILHPTQLSYLSTRESFSPPYEINLRARWTDRQARRYGLFLYVGATTADPRNEMPAYRVMLRPDTRSNRQRLSATVTRGSAILNTLLDTRPRRYDDRRATFLPRFEEISPVWDADFRTEIEAAMAPIPSQDLAWMHVRVVVLEESVTFYVNGHCLGEYRYPELVTGRVLVECRDDTLHLSELTVTRPDSRPGFVPVMLDSLVNARALGANEDFALAADALPEGGSRIQVQDVPFLLPQRNSGDHVDIGTSLFHYRNNNMRVNMRMLWPTFSQLDANRLIVSVPNRPYRRLWVLAANDDDPHSVPLLTVRFFRQTAGFPIDAQAEIPGPGEASSDQAVPISVDGPDGAPRQLWLVPIELDGNTIASELREEESLAIEFTKQVFDYTPYPDPMYFSSFQGGPASSVRLFAATLEEAPLRLITKGKRPGSVFIQPEFPIWQVELTSFTNQTQDGQLSIQVTDPNGQSQPVVTQQLEVLPQASRTVEIPLPTKVYGLHDVTTTWTAANGETIVEHGRFVQLPPDNRRTIERNSRWGLWTWHGGHGTNPNPDENGYLLRAAGARGPGSREYQDRARWKLFPRPIGISYRAPRWAFDDPDNKELQEKHAAEMVDAAKRTLEANPDSPWLAYYLEDVSSIELMFGEYPKYLGKEGDETWTEEQKAAYEARFLAARIAFEAIRKEVPKARLSLGWTHPQFQIPLLRMGFPADLFDAIGIDFPTFMRMPEMPLRDIAPNRMWLLNEEMKRLGYANKPIIHHETYFPSSQPQALGERTAADYTVRFAVLSLALGSDYLHHCFSLHDCSDYWGSQHYGASGLVGKRPEYIPKLAFPAYATMTRLLDTIVHDSYLPTGSLSTYCVSFTNRNTLQTHKHIYSLWALRGERDIELTFSEGSEASVVDAHGNEQPLALTDLSTRLTLSETPLWVISTAPLTTAQVTGPTTHNARPAGPTRSIASMASGWRYNPEPFARLEENNPVLAPFYNGPMATEVVDAPEGGQALRVSLQTPPEERPTVDWYGVFEPANEVVIPGQAEALGLWVNGSSSWGRVIYEVEDANGERFLSTGAPENWNGDDSKQRSYFNFDGWRYVEFPLPTNEPFDGYRGFHNVWWGYDQEGTVDLPLKLTKVIITQRSHHVYVNELVEVPEPTVDIGQLVAVYGSEQATTEAPIVAQAMPALTMKDVDLGKLPNPYRDLQASSDLPAPTFREFTKPETWYDGTQIMVHIEPVEDVRAYKVYVSAYPDGTGAASMGSSAEPAILVRRLRPEYPLYVFVTYLTQRRAESKPSEIHRLLLKDDFPNK